MLEELTGKIYQKLLDYAYYKPRSEREVTDKLKTLCSTYLSEVSDEDLVLVVKIIRDKTSEDEAFDEVKSVNMYVQSFVNSTQPRSIRSIQNFLYKKRFKSDTIDASLAQIPETLEKECIANIIQKTRKKPELLKKYLLSKGYRYELIEEVTSNTD